jgi:hypothetical protein
MNTKSNKGRKKESTIQDKFLSLLKKYVGIKTIEIIITMKSGEVILLNRDREIEGNQVVLYKDGSPLKRISISEIEKAELFAA